jgi:hypothetical protein
MTSVSEAEGAGHHVVLLPEHPLSATVGPGAAHDREGKVNTSQDVDPYNSGIERAGAEGAEQPLRWSWC